jgi:DNA-binding transcriptional regulator YiaG
MELAAKYDTNDMTIRDRLLEQNVELRPRKRIEGKVYLKNAITSVDTLSQEVNMRREWGLDDYEISRILNVSVNSVVAVKKR